MMERKSVGGFDGLAKACFAWRRNGRALLLALAGLGSGGSRALAVPPVPVPPENPITEPKRVLGKILFWDEQLSTSNTVSCATCHNPAVGGSDSRPRVRNAGVDGVLNTVDDLFGSSGII